MSRPVSRWRYARSIAPPGLDSARLALPVAVLALLATAQPAAAHELEMLVVAPPRDAAAGPAVDGLRLAVDQSPDVSHPPGADAGDHLGGIDVDITLARSRREALRAVGGAPIVVVLSPPPAISRRLVGELLSRVPPSSGPLVVAAGTRATLPARLGVPVVLLGDRPRGRVDRDRAARFERAFSRRYRRSPERAARRGYDAGRLVDRLLARLGEGPFRLPAIAAAAPAADRALVAGTAQVVRPDAESEDASASRGDTSDDQTAALVAVAGVGVAALAAASLAGLARRRRHPRPGED